MKLRGFLSKQSDLIGFTVATAIAYVALYIYSPQSVGTALSFGLANMEDLLAIFVFASLLAGLVDAYVEKEMIAKVFNPRRRDLSNYLIATVIGIATPGPVYSIFPIVLVLRKKGVRTDFLISYLTGQTLMGPMRVPLELWFLGMKFFVYRLVITVIIGVLAGAMSRPLVGWIEEELNKIAGEG